MDLCYTGDMRGINIARAGPMTRTRSMQAEYLEYLSSIDTSLCSFCDLTQPRAPQPIKTYDHFYIAENGFGYLIWDGCLVKEHLMLIPKKHVPNLRDLSGAAQKEFAQIVAKYEEAGYSFYGRSPDNVTRSIAHQHTHLLRLGSRRKSFMLYIRKPHVLLSK